MTKNSPKKLTLAIVVIVAVAAASISIASARWVRFSSSLDAWGDDIAVCSDHLTFSNEYQLNGLELPGYDPAIGSEYPSGPATIPLFDNFSDAENNVNPIVTLSIDMFLTEPGFNDAPPSEEPRYVGTKYFGEVTVPTPAGVDDGDTIYGNAQRPGEATYDVVAFTVGDPSYECDITIRDLPLDFLFASDDIRIPVDQRVIIFDGRFVDPATLVIRADGGKDTPVHFLGSSGPFGFALVNLGQAGVDCSSTQLILTGDGGGDVGTLDINPFGRTCVPKTAR